MENETVIVEEKRLKEDIDKLDSGARERYFHLLLKEQTEQTKKQKSFVQWSTHNFIKQTSNIQLHNWLSLRENDFAPFIHFGNY